MYGMLDPKNFKPSKSLIGLAELVFLAMAHEALIRGKVVPYQTEILATKKFRPSQGFLAGGGIEDAPIIEPSRTWLMGDEDHAEYMRLCKEAEARLGLKASKPENCPLLEAESLRREAEGVMLDGFASEAGMPHFAHQEICSHIEIMKKVIRLQLGLLAPFVRNAPAILASTA